MGGPTGPCGPVLPLCPLCPLFPLVPLISMSLSLLSSSLPPEEEGESPPPPPFPLLRVRHLCHLLLLPINFRNCFRDNSVPSPFTIFTPSPEVDSETVIVRSESSSSCSSPSCSILSGGRFLSLFGFLGGCPLFRSLPLLLSVSEAPQTRLLALGLDWIDHHY